MCHGIDKFSPIIYLAVNYFLAPTGKLNEPFYHRGRERRQEGRSQIKILVRKVDPVGQKSVQASNLALETSLPRRF